MLLTAVLMFTSVDLRFQEALADHFPSFLTNPTGGLEKTAAVEDELAGLRGKPKFDDDVVAALAQDGGERRRPARRADAEAARARRGARVRRSRATGSTPRRCR